MHLCGTRSRASECGVSGSAAFLRHRCAHGSTGSATPECAQPRPGAACPLQHAANARRRHPDSSPPRTAPPAHACGQPPLGCGRGSRRDRVFPARDPPTSASARPLPLPLLLPLPRPRSRLPSRGHPIAAPTSSPPAPRPTPHPNPPHPTPAAPRCARPSHASVTANPPTLHPRCLCPPCSLRSRDRPRPHAEICVCPAARETNPPLPSTASRSPAQAGVNEKRRKNALRGRHGMRVQHGVKQRECGGQC